MEVRTKKFENGATLRYLHLSKNRPATVAIAVGVGSKFETPEINGISHFIEHMTFKGSKTRDSKQINQCFDDLGVMANAFTGKTRTVFHTVSLEEKLEECFEILTDMVFDPAFDENELEKERGVVLEEMANDEDDPATLAYYKLCEQVFGQASYGMPVIGTKKSVMSLTKNNLIDFHKKHYVCQNVVVSVATNKKLAEVENLVKKYVFARAKKIEKFEEPKKLKVNLPQKQFDWVKKEFVQQNILLGFVVSNIPKNKKSVCAVLNFVLAGGMSSRLFQKLREEHGLVYSVFSSMNYYGKGGVEDISIVASEKNAKKALELIRQELDLLKQNGISNEELERAKMIFKTSLVRSDERSTSTAIGAATKSKIVSTAKLLRQIEKISTDDVLQMAQKIFDYDHMCATVVAKNQIESLFDCFKN